VGNPEKANAFLLWWGRYADVRGAKVGST